MPILGIIASSLLAAAGDFESIATVSVGSGGTSSVTFSSIPGTFAHLQIRAIGRTNRSNSDLDDIRANINGSSGSGKRTHFLYGEGASALASENSNYLTLGWGGAMTGGLAAASIFGVAVIDILDYANTNKYKTIRCLDGADLNGSGRVVLNSTLWDSTSAITSIELIPGFGTTIQQYSHFALYGIRSA